MKILNCRSCHSNNLKQVMDLGSQYLTGIFPKKKNSKVSKGRLSLALCENCKLLQLENSFNNEEMYGENYGYMSSLNQSMSNHLKNKALNLKKIVKLDIDDIVIDIGSNDGTFLSYFEKKFQLIGVDPTIKKFKRNYRKDIKTVSDFFSYDIIRKYLGKKRAKLITSIACFYDLLNPIKFVEDIYQSLDDNGVWHFEQSYMPSMIKNMSYDTICHEHLEYYSLKSVKYILDKVGFKINNIELNSINGGSFALTVSKKNSSHSLNSKMINWLLHKEDLFKFNDVKTIKEFSINAKKQKILLRNLINNLLDMNKNVLGYGASTKGNVILQYCKINSSMIPYIGDVNSFKYNKFTPGTNIKIISEEKLKSLKPDYLLVLPWHFRDFIINKEKNFLNNGGHFIFPLPDIEII